MKQRRIRKAIGLILATVIIAGAARGDERKAYRETILRQQAQLEVYNKRLELLPGKRKIDDLIRIVDQDGVLVMDSPLFASAEQMKDRPFRVEVEGFAGFCTVTVQPANGVARYFTFSNISYPDLEGVRSVTVMMQPGLLQIAQNFTSRNSSYNVTLAQTQGRTILGHPDGVEFNVYGSDNSGKASVNLDVDAPGFAWLRREHPREVDRYLRPLLRELKLETLFAVDDQTAWQVFSEEWQGNPAVAAKVKALLPELALNSYARREAARQALRKLGPQAALVIYSMNRDGLTAEQNCRLDAVLSANSFLSRVEAQRLLTDNDFLLDCLYSPSAAIRSMATKHLQQAMKRDQPLEMPENLKDRISRVAELRKTVGGRQ